MSETEFESLWRAAVGYRQTPRELRRLVEAVHRDLMSHSPDLKADLEALLSFLTSKRGRTDANCCAVDRFFAACEADWNDQTPAVRAIFRDMSGTLHDAIYAPKIAASFDSLPEQLLERVRAIETR